MEPNHQITLPEGFRLRRPTWDDAEGVTNLIILTDLADRGESDFSVQELRSSWSNPTLDLNRDLWLIETEDGLVVAYEELYNRSGHTSLVGDGYVHGDYQGRGLGTILLHLMEARAREHIALAPDGRRVHLRHGLSGQDKASYALLSQFGFEPVRYFWRMQIELDGPPPEHHCPQGVRIDGFEPEAGARPLFDALEDSFRDHWGFEPWNYESWHAGTVESETFDPGLWLVARSGQEVAGGAVCRMNEANGWVATLGVRKPWRKQGLGLALLQASFNKFYERGVWKVGLSVDASNPTGATRLYEKAGMRVIHEYVVLEKELRPESRPSGQGTTPNRSNGA